MVCSSLDIGRMERGLECGGRAGKTPPHPELEREKSARGKVNCPLTFRRFEAAAALESRGRIS